MVSDGSLLKSPLVIYMCAVQDETFGKVTSCFNIDTI